MNLVKVISSEFDSLSRRIVKYLRFGRDDVQTSFESMPSGVDSSPIKDMIAVYASTEEKGKTVIVGYLNVNQISGPGEYRIFSQNDQGDVETFIHLKDDGTMEIGGASDFMVRYLELETAFNQLQSDHDSLVTTFNTHVHPGVTAGPASTLVTLTTETPSTADITPAKIEEIKTL